MRPLRIIVPCVLVLAASNAAAVQIQSIARLKGQEPITLSGPGLVVGLNGTGDARFTPAQEALARTLAVRGNPIQRLADISSVRNIALVWVTCEIPGVGGRDGDEFDCFVASTGTARSLLGGRLIAAALNGPRVDDDTVYAMAAGSIILEDPLATNSGRIKNGARLVQDLFAPYLKCDDRVTLVINSDTASFATANLIANRINQRIRFQVSRTGNIVDFARALDAKNVEVILPDFARSDPVPFVADIMTAELDANAVNTQARITINEKTETIAVTGEVQVAPVMVTHKNLIIFPPGLAPPPGTPGAPNDFVPLTDAQPVPGPDPFPNNPELANLSDILVALNRAQVSAADKIQIIKELAKTGKLHAKVSYE
jgi:flagellar P-ring protein precursor FlgI